MASNVKTPLVLWAQRSSATTRQMNFIYLTVNLRGILHSTLKYTVTKGNISLNVNAKEPRVDQECKYTFELDFHAEVVPKALEYCMTPQSFTLIIFKKHVTAQNWPQLSKTVLSYVKTDLSQWTWEGDGPESLDKSGSIFAQVGIETSFAETTSGGLLKKQLNQDSAPSGIMTPAITQAVWVQQSALTDRIKTDSDKPGIETGQHFMQAVNLTNRGVFFQMQFERLGDMKDIEKAILSFSKAVTLTPDGHMEKPNRLISLGIVLSTRFRHLGKLEDIEKSILSLEDAVRLTPDAHANRYLTISNLGSMYEFRFEHTGNLQDIDCAISHHKRAIKSTPSGHGDPPSVLNNLGNSYMRRFKHSGNFKDLEHALSYHKSAVKSTPSGSADLPGWLNSLGNSYMSHFQHSGNFQDIDLAISHYQSALESTPSGDTDLPSWFTNLGNSYLCRFKHTGNLDDIEHTIVHHQSAVKSTPPGHIDLPSRFSNLGNSYLCCFEHTGNLQDIDHAISYHQNSVESTPLGHADLLSSFNDLGNSYLHRFQCTGDLEDIKQAISYHQSAVNSTPPGHADLLSRFNDLGNSYLRQFQRTGDLDDIEQAISYHQSAVKSTPAGHADLPIWLGNLGTSYICRFQCKGDLQDIEHAISHLQSALESTPPGHTDFSDRLSNLGTAYLRRFEHTGDLQDIDHAITHHQNAIESTPSGHAYLRQRFHNLGTSYLCRFECTSNLEDIQHAISHHLSAIKCTPSGHTGLLNCFENLGRSYLCRFQHTRNIEDIEHAIFYQQKVVKATPSDHAGLPERLTGLGNSYLHRFEHTGNLADIKDAISHHQKAVKSTPAGHPGRPTQLNNLGNSYSLRFGHTGNPQDIEHAISCQESAVKSSPSGNASLPNILNSLGNSYSRRFSHTTDLQDIDLAISNHQSAIKSMPSGNSSISACFKNLGYSYRSRFKQTHSLSDFQNSIDSYRQGAKANGAPSTRLKSARLAAMLSSLHDDHSPSDCLVDFDLAISLLSEVAGLEQTIHHRHANLHGHSDLVGLAVMTALRHSRADLALEWLEQGRCLVWNQLNQLRTPIDDLYIRHPSLADQFVKVARNLEFHGTRPFSSISSTHIILTESILLQDEIRNHTLLAAEYRKLLEDIRAFPEFHNFLQPPKAANILSSLPPDGPVIIFNFYETHCDALALIAGIKDPLHIPLEKFTLAEGKKLQEMLQSDLLKLREAEDGDRLPCRVSHNLPSMVFILKELWYKVVQPILEVLGLSTESCPNLPYPHRHRIWWCPTGPLAFLPLHAAGVYDLPCEAQQCVSDFVVSSYTPTVRTLNEKFKASCSSSKYPSLVIISQPNTPGLSSIPYTQTEANNLQKLMDGIINDTLLLVDSKATRDKVKAEMKSHSWVHFACHGVQDVSEPLKSGLCLHDGRLELFEIMKEQILNLDLAFLSACQTSKGDLKLSEEVVHLAAGMLSVGYHGVVGTMWSISDKHGPNFAIEFYKYLLRGKGPGELDSAEAAHALDYATWKVRKRLEDGDSAFLTWVPYVHFGY